ncbi:hypothetical protein [Sulfurospirillum arcachonense]|uniref:hypothetical protein n=1 Tax=Sulfurospirillum arcachonense TaxID=57666 RepID=UPI000467F4C2|nr:hypothetical protein [Sulfurospirillum arcachonense]
MRFSYKHLVDRFLIPRPTLIEWQKRVKKDKENWRVKHLEYLREQLIIEEMTLEELKAKPISSDDVFLACVFLFFNKQCDYMQKNNFKKDLRAFAYAHRDGVEYKHDFAKKIWNIELNDGSGRKISNYYKLIDILDSMTASQFGFFVRLIKQFIEKIEEKVIPSHTDLLDGITWQEMHMYEKAFSDKVIKKHFSFLCINHQEPLFT